MNVHNPYILKVIQLVYKFQHLFFHSEILWGGGGVQTILATSVLLSNRRLSIIWTWFLRKGEEGKPSPRKG